MCWESDGKWAGNAGEEVHLVSTAAHPQIPWAQPPAGTETALTMPRALRSCELQEVHADLKAGDVQGQMHHLE